MATALGSAWGRLAKSLKELGQILVTFLGDCLGESLGKSFNVLAASWLNSRGILGQMPRIFGQALQIAGGVSASSLGNYWRRGGYWPNLRWHSWATALGSPAGSLSKCLRGSWPNPGDGVGPLPWGGFGETLPIAGGSREFPWEILGAGLHSPWGVLAKS